MGKVIAGLMILAALGVTGWYFYTAIPAANDFEAAAASGNGDAVMSFVDVPVLKEDIAKYVRAKFDQPDNPAADLTPDAVKGIVDAFVTPANIILLMKGVKFTPGMAVPDAPDPKAPPMPIDQHYAAPDQYAIDVYFSQVQTPDNKVLLMFEREGWFDWKLSAIRFGWTS